MIGRRRFVAGALAAAVGGTSARGAEAARAEGESPGAASPANAMRFDAIAFDGFVIFDPRPIAATAEALFPGRGGALVDAWRVRQFDYQWLRALGGRYADFMQTTDAALAFAAKQIGVEFDASTRERLLDGYRNLQTWPDAAAVLATLHASGVRLAMLSNMTQPMLSNGLDRGGVASLVDAILSTDAIATYKPDPRAYRLGVDALRLPRERILFAAFAGWDVVGAKWFGYPTFWVNRLGGPPEELGAAADGAGPDLAALQRFATERDR